MAVSDELIYLGCKSGTVELWSKEKLSRVGTLQTRTSGKVQCMDLNGDEEVLVFGTSDGRIQVTCFKTYLISIHLIFFMFFSIKLD